MNSGEGEGVHFDMESGTFNYNVSAFMWPSGALMFAFRTFF